MKVLFLPYWGKSNPYQKLLSIALTKYGVKIIEGKDYKIFCILRNLKDFWKPSIIHLHWQHPFLISRNRQKTFIKSAFFILELILIRVLGIKIVWTVHNLKSHENRYQRLELFFTCLLAKLSYSIIAHCEIAKCKIKKEFNISNDKKVDVIPHGNYLNYYMNKISRTEARTKLSISPQEKVFLYLGQIRPYKGLSKFIKLFRQLNIESARLIIAGKPCNEQIATLIRNEVTENENIKLVLRFIEDNEIQIFMNAADVVVLPYEGILTSGGIILAMSFGKAIIAPRLGCIPDTLDDFGSFLYNIEEDDGLMKAVRRSLENKINLEKMGSHNLKLAKSLDWDSIAKKTYEIYKRCLKSAI